MLHSLASHPNSEEYQIDRTIVWIMIPNDEERQNWIAKGRAMFSPVWQDTGPVIEMAQRHSQMQHPEFWQQFKPGIIAKQILAVRGVWVYPINGTALYEVYDVSEFPDDWSGFLLPDEYLVDIARDKDGRLSIQI